MWILGLRQEDIWTIATAILCANACALPGCFLVLRRMSLLGDAISHGILPGIALAFMFTGERSITPMIVGALAAGLATAGATGLLHRFGRVPADAAMGIVFSSFFALGVILISWAARDVDLDPGCVLYGLIEFTPFDTVSILGYEIPKAFLILSAICAINILVVTVFFKELVLSSFDNALARSLGFFPGLIQTGLLVLITTTTVASFESVGSIVVVSFLVTPAATAHLLTNRMSHFVLIALLSATLAAIVGYLLAVQFNTSVAGMMSVVSGLEFVSAVLFAPHQGLIARFANQARTTLRICREDILGLLYREQEKAPGKGLEITQLRQALPITTPTIFRFGIAMLRKHDSIEQQDQTVRLTKKGLDIARTIVRSHRLWETYLEQNLALPLDHLHIPSDYAEHFISKELRTKLESEMTGSKDPHGKIIPKE